MSSEHPPEWLPPCLRVAYLGMAARRGRDAQESLPTLDWKIAARQLTTIGGMSIAEAGEALLDTRMLWLVPVTRAHYWDAIRNKGMKAWDELHDLCIGIALKDGIRAPVYDRLGTIRYFQDGFVDTSGTVANSELRRMALERFQQILGYYNGEGTPYFIG